MSTPVYLDHAATTPMSPAALDAYTRHARITGNPSSLHAAGRAARRVVEESRETIAAAVGAHPSEVIFTSGGTETDNLAIKGIYWACRAADPRRNRILVSAVEHHAVLDPAFWLAKHCDAEVVLLPVDGDGVVDLTVLRAELDVHGDETALVSVMFANNEVGTIQPVHGAAQLVRAAGVPFHTDAAQAVGQTPVSFATLGVDAMTITAHKLGGPVGIGALVARRNLPLEGTSHGGSQERGVRSGTLDVAAIAAFAAAVDDAVGQLDTRAERMAALRDSLIAGVRSAVPAAVLRGPQGAGRLPGNVHFTFPGCEGDSLLYLLDSAGIAVSTGSACQAGIAQPSHMLLAMGLSEAEARGALRFTLGVTSTSDDVAALLAALPDAVARASTAGLSSCAPLIEPDLSSCAKSQDLVTGAETRSLP